MGQKDDVRSILELQDEIVQRRAVWDSAPWLELNMSTPQLKALLLISDEEAIRMRELARKLGGSFSNATVLVDRLVDRGLVERLMDPDDRRVVLVRATGEGQALIEQLVTSWRALSESVLDSMDPEDIAALRRGLAAPYQRPRPRHPDQVEAPRPRPLLEDAACLTGVRNARGIPSLAHRTDSTRCPSPRGGFPRHWRAASCFSRPYAPRPE